MLGIIKMNYVIEAFIIGCYSLLLSLPLSVIIKDNNILFFLTGFLKHFLGHYIGIHSIYCEMHHLRLNKVNIVTLLEQSILEGFLYVIGGNLIFKYFNVSSFFIIGFILHIIFEIIGIHRSFISNSCSVTKL